MTVRSNSALSRRWGTWVSGAASAVVALSCVGTLAASPAQASPVEVLQAEFSPSGGGGWSVSVTLRHADTGWEHYANLWVVETLEGKELGRRVLFHPHETEQPFTRSAQLQIPAGTTRLRIRAGDNIEGINSNAIVVDLTTASGKGSTVR